MCGGRRGCWCCASALAGVLQRAPGTLPLALLFRVRRFTRHVGSLRMKREAGRLSGQKWKRRRASLASAGVYARRAEWRIPHSPRAAGIPVAPLPSLFCSAPRGGGHRHSAPHRCAHRGFSGGGGQPGPRTGSDVSLNVGRGGETIRSICKASGAKITCDKESEGTLLLSRLIKISGTQKEVAAAKASS